MKTLTGNKNTVLIGYLGNRINCFEGHSITPSPCVPQLGKVCFSVNRSLVGT